MPAAGEHFPNGTEVIAGIKICRRRRILTLLIIPLADRISRVAEFELFPAEPDDLARRVDRAASFLDDFHDTAQAIVGEFASGCESGVVDSDQPVRAIPFEGPRATIASDASVEIIGQRPIDPAALARDLVHVIGRRCGSGSRDCLGRPVTGGIITVSVLLDQRVGGCVLERRGRQLIRIVVSEIEPLRRGQARVILCPGRDFALDVVGVIKLGNELFVRVVIVVQVFDLLEAFVLGVWKVGVVG